MRTIRNLERGRTLLNMKGDEASYGHTLEWPDGRPLPRNCEVVEEPKRGKGEAKGKAKK